MFYRSFQLFAALVIVAMMVPQAIAKKVKNPEDIPLEAFAQLTSTSDMQLSPDGTHMAYSMVHKGRRVIIIKPLEQGKAVALPMPDRGEVSWFGWANATRLVVSYGFTNKRRSVITRETRLYGVDRDGKNFKNLIRPKKEKSSVSNLSIIVVPAQFQDRVIDWLPDDPDHILLVIDGDRDGKHEVRRLDVNDGKFREIISGTRGIQGYATDQQHQIRRSWGFDEINSKMSEYKNMYKSPLTNQWKSVEKTSWGEKGFHLLDFTEDQLPQGYDFNRLSQVFGSTANKQLLAYAEMRPIQERVSYEY